MTMTPNALFSLWGCGTGPLRSLQPHVRILSGMLLGCACMTAPLPSISGVILVSTVTIAWWGLAGMPLTMTLRSLLAALILFSPFLLLTPWMTTDPGAAAPLIDRLSNAGAIALRSSCCLFIAASAVSSLPLSDAHCGLANLPLPRTLAILMVQLVTQTALLVEETGHVMAALRIRAASGIRVLYSFPVVWMARILFRADRTATAMTVRGYGDETPAMRTRPAIAPRDLLAIAASAAICAAAIFMRTGIVA
jgi:energy-coupling factor transporter transmembrane protein EcfT